MSGRWWSATMNGHVGYESWLERDHLMLLDYDQDAVGIASQPFLLYWTTAEGNARSHAPASLARRADGWHPRRPGRAGKRRDRRDRQRRRPAARGPGRAGDRRVRGGAGRARARARRRPGSSTVTPWTSGRTTTSTTSS